MDDDRMLEILDAQDKRRIAKLLDLEARVIDLEAAYRKRGELRMVVSLPRWIFAYVLFSANMLLFYYDVRVFFSISIWAAIAIALVIIPVAGYFFLTGMGLVREFENDKR